MFELIIMKVIFQWSTVNLLQKFQYSFWNYPGVSNEFLTKLRSEILPGFSFCDFLFKKFRDLFLSWYFYMSLRPRFLPKAFLRVILAYFGLSESCRNYTRSSRNFLQKFLSKFFKLLLPEFRKFFTWFHTKFHARFLLEYLSCTVIRFDITQDKNPGEILGKSWMWLSRDLWEKAEQLEITLGN